MGALIDVTDRTVSATDEPARLVAEHERVLVAIALAIFDARVRVAAAALRATRRARGDFVRGEDRAGLEGALVTMRLADETTRRVGAAEMRRAVDALIDRARRAV